ncbi:hypothetical protein AbraIFM66951_008511 [Aspergillus brasiliensis]|uniref:Alpha/beta hydrolase fold-3 domain-containing protein n=1 Tax=Aspergillus brasiliensis TaxID=319629 RepID=A0A9W5YUY1_9EURO|nr:hypothetical protein AbraCBS73388_009848 [Aspergillus brasiliensis]GKZ45817.1 hypothetical protein AbraIFM66951_008511 [Aspergillus brasiliensis]
MVGQTLDPWSHLLAVLSSVTYDKYDPFDIINTKYKVFGPTGAGIDADILIPRPLSAERGLLTCPIIVRIHGGFLVTGSSLYPPWFSNWILDYAIQNEAIIISPNYRLLPEATGEDILEDMYDFWNWLQGDSLSHAIRDAGYPHIGPATDKTLIVGESAGGYLAMQLALTYPSKIRAVVGAYPILDPKDKFYTEAYQKPILRVPNMANDIIEQHLASLRASHTPRIVTAAESPERLRLAFAVFQNGRLLEFLGSRNNPELFPMERVERLAAVGRLKVPPLFIFHGEQDSAVPVEGTRRFVNLLHQKGHVGQVHIYIQDGDHGFDFDATLETPWLRSGLEMISEAWMGSKDGTLHL